MLADSGTDSYSMPSSLSQLGSSAKNGEWKKEGRSQLRSEGLFPWGTRLGRRRASVSPGRFFRSPFFALRPNELNVWKKLLPGMSLQMEQSDVTARAPQEHITRLIYTTPEEYENRGFTFPVRPSVLTSGVVWTGSQWQVFLTSSSPLHLRRLKQGQLEEILMKKWKRLDRTKNVKEVIQGWCLGRAWNIT